MSEERTTTTSKGTVYCELRVTARRRSLQLVLYELPQLGRPLVEEGGNVHLHETSLRAPHQPVGHSRRRIVQFPQNLKAKAIKKQR